MDNFEDFFSDIGSPEEDVSTKRDKEEIVQDEIESTLPVETPPVTEDVAVVEGATIEKTPLNTVPMEDIDTEATPTEAVDTTPKRYTPAQQLDDIYAERDEQDQLYTDRLKELQEIGTPESKQKAFEIKAIRRKKMQEYEKEISELEKELPPITERIGAEIKAAGAAFESSAQDIEALIQIPLGKATEFIGEKLDSDMIKRAGELIVANAEIDQRIWGEDVAEKKQEHARLYTKGAWNVGETVGESVIDFAAGYAKGIKGIATTETVLASAREKLFTKDDVPIINKMATIGTDVVASIVGMKLLGSLLPDSQVKQLDDIIETVKDPAQKKELQGALRAIDNSGIKSLDYDARDRILKAMTKGEIADDATLSAAIREEVKVAKQASKDALDAAYREADEVAEASLKYTPTGNTLIRLKKFKAGEKVGSIEGEKWSANKETRSLIDEFEKEMKLKSGGTAADLEGLRKAYVGKSAATDDRNTQRLYKKMIDFIDEESSKLFTTADNMPYRAAREMNAEHVNKFFRGAEGFNADTAKKFDMMLTNPRYTGEAERLFNSKIDANAAKSYKEIVGGDQNILDKSVQIMIMDGIDPADRATQEGLELMLENYSKMKPAGLIEMLGDEGHKELKTRMRGMQIVKDAIDESTLASEKKILGDVGDFLSAVALYKVSPYVSARIGVKSGRSILSKTLASDRSALMKRISESKITAPLRKGLQGLMLSKINKVEDENAAQPEDIEAETTQAEIDTTTVDTDTTADVDDTFFEDISEYEPKGKPMASASGGVNNDSVYTKLSEREGVKDVVYKDSLGKPTAGIGHLLTDAEKKRYPVGTRIPKAQIDKWYEQDTRKARNAAKLQAKEIGEPRLEEALIHVNFQLGTNWKRKFKETYALLKKGKYDSAINNLKKSKWMKQTPKRVNDFIEEIEKLT